MQVEDATSPSSVSAQRLLADISRLNQEYLRANEEKINLAQAAYDSASVLAVTYARTNLFPASIPGRSTCPTLGHCHSKYRRAPWYNSASFIQAINNRGHVFQPNTSLTRQSRMTDLNLKAAPSSSSKAGPLMASPRLKPHLSWLDRTGRSVSMLEPRNWTQHRLLRTTLDRPASG